MLGRRRGRPRSGKNRMGRRTAPPSSSLTPIGPRRPPGLGPEHDSHTGRRAGTLFENVLQLQAQHHSTFAECSEITRFELQQPDPGEVRSFLLSKEAFITLRDDAARERTKNN